MKYANKTIELQIENPSYVKVLDDPAIDGISHVETLLSFREAAKLKLGNANVRPPIQNKKPFKAMTHSVEWSPALFHIKNRGITYICTDVKVDEKNGKLVISVPDVKSTDTDGPKFGIADGGHTFEVINQTLVSEKEKAYENMPKWILPYVRVRFLVVHKDFGDVEAVVEALNTSSQVQQYTLDEYKNKFAPLKEALADSGFDTDLVAFRENEDKEWHVIEIIQRAACFLKQKWLTKAPINMYKSKGKALKLFTGEDTQGEFREVFKVIKDIITLPEYIQSQFSMTGIVSAKSLAKLKCVKLEKKTYTRPGTDYPTMHQIDLAALLPMAAAFRELLVKNKNVYEWGYDYKEIFDMAAPYLFEHMVHHAGRVAMSSQMASDPDYWSGCVQIILRAEKDLRDGKRTKSITRTTRKLIEETDEPEGINEEDQEYSQLDAAKED